MISTNPSLTKSTPRMVYTGIKQGKLGSIPYTTTPLPQALPHFQFFAERGETTPRVTASSDIVARYGSGTQDQSQPFYTHQSSVMKVFTDLGCTIMTERLKPPAATTAFLRLSAELIPATINRYLRNADGSIVYTVDQQTGLQTPTLASPATALGWRVVIHTDISMYPSGLNGAAGKNTFGAAGGPSQFRTGEIVSTIDPTLTLGVIDSTPGDSTTAVPQQSKIYPLWDMQVASFGKYGNYEGVIITAPTSTTSPAVDLVALMAVGAYPYSIQCVEGSATSLIPSVVPTAAQNESMLMILKENVIDPNLGTPLSFSDSFIKTYGDPKSTTHSPGPMGRLKVYSDNITELLGKLINGDTVGGYTILGEASYHTAYAAVGGDIDFRNPQMLHMLNFLTGVDQNNIPYFSFDVQSSAGFGGINIEDGAAIYAKGGSDGLIMDANGRPDRKANLQLLDQLVQNRCVNYANGIGPNMLNVARYPCSLYFDSGYSIDTKKALMSLTSLRKDITVITGIYRVCDMVLNGSGPDPVWDYVPHMTELEKQSVAATLYSAAQLTPESTVDGTGACRIAIVRGDSAPFDPKVPYNLPFTFDVAYHIAQYMGNSSGNWDARFAWDLPQNKAISYIGDLSDDNDLTEPQQDKYWDIGTCYPVYSDDRSIVWPMLRTVHNEPTSPLVALEFVIGCTTAVKEANKVWLQLCGSNLDENQFVERSNDLLSQALNASTRFAGKFKITVNTVITAADAQRRFSWTTQIDFASSPYKTVNKLILTGDTVSYSPAATGT